ncbi:MAG: hypothetical protein IJU25_08750, partial [Lachnospiraceae bacterium]|nr:hypothetical protein [Lachnospiraceae bacterium]
MGTEKKNRDFDHDRKGGIVQATILGSLVVAVILIIGTVWTGRSASRDAEKAARNVSLLYLDELAGRREQVVESTLNHYIKDMDAAIGLIDKSDLSSVESLQTYQARMRLLYGLERFAFVDENGLIYTSRGTRTDIDQYDFVYHTLSGPSVFVKDAGSHEKSVIIAVPVDRFDLAGKTLVACFLEMSMDHLLDAVSLQAGNNNTTFCNIYRSDGVPFTGLVLGGLSAEDNLLTALENADFEAGYDCDGVKCDFKEHHGGVVSFTYDGIRETLSYVPVHGTDWMLTYLIRESVISEQIEAISAGIIRRSLILSVILAAVLLALSIFMILQTRKAVKLASEQETAERLQQELEERIALQDELLEQEQARTQQDNMITALASDYRSVYYVDLDIDRGICYRKDTLGADNIGPGDEFDYLAQFKEYADTYVAEEYRDAFLDFIKPDSIRAALKDNAIITLRYLVRKDGVETYEMLRMAGVRHPEDRKDHIVHAVGAGFTDIDA